MRRRRTNRIRKRISIFLIALLTITLMIPQSTFAEVSKPSQVSESSEMNEYQLEKQKEEEADKGINGKNEASEEHSLSSEGILSLMDGLDIESGSQFNEADLVMDGKVEARITKQLEEKDTVNVIIRLKESVEMTSLFTQVGKTESKEERGTLVVNKLQEKASATQGKLLKQLESFEAEGEASNIRSFWVFNGVAATVTKEALDKIAMRDDVEVITLDAEIQLPETTTEDTEPRLPEWGVESILAPKVWGEYGIQGEGVVVGIMDSGVQGDHEALRHNYRGRDGNHQHSWIDLSGHNYKTPKDGNGHGTHVAGSAVGGGEGEPIGVAPGAEWIAAKIFDDGGGTTASSIHEAFQWFIAPGGDPTKAPDVVNNSWGSSNTYRTEFLEGVQAWVAAGIFPLFAAGNDGPGSGTIGSPGSFPEAFAVGAIDRFDQIASFSSRGPVYWPDENGNPVYYVKPQVSAPGHQIYSAIPNGGYGVKSGTSMATPHVAGAIALLLESDPTLTIDEIASLLESTTRTGEHMGDLPNDVYGHGIVNIYQAVTEATFAGTVEGTLTDKDGNPISGEILIPSQELSIKVEADGQYEFKVREGEHKVEIRSFGYFTQTKTIKVEQNKTLAVDFQLETAPRHDISGTVKDEEGNPVAYAYVRVADTPIETVRTNANGEFTITKVPESTFTILAGASGYKQAVNEILVDKDLNLAFTIQSIGITASPDWNTSRNNYNRNAVTNAEIDAEKLVRDWTFETPGQVLFSSPVIAEGKVVFTTERGNVVVLDQHTGKEVWNLRTGSSNRSTPTVVDGVVYVAGGADSSIHAINLETGMKIWSRGLSFPAIYEAPIYQDGKLYVSSHMDDDAKVTALNAETGAVIWEKVIGDYAFFGPALGDGVLYVGAYDSKNMTGLDIDTGEEVWQVTKENVGFAASPVYVDGVVYAVGANFDNGTGTLFAFDGTTGEELWANTSVGNTESGSPIVYDNLVIIGSASYPVIKAFDKDSGELIWEADNGSAMVNSGAVSANGHLYVTDIYSNKLKVYDVFTGDRLYEYTLAGSSLAGVALTNGQVVAVDQGSIYSFIAPGTLSGQVTDEEGNGLEGTVTIVETGETVETDETGNYQLEALPGEYTIKVAVYGYVQQSETVTFVSGLNITKNYQLQEAGTGSVSGSVVHKLTGDALEGVSITVNGTPLEGRTDEKGEFRFTEVSEGTFDFVMDKPGFVSQVIPVTVESGQEATLQIEMQSIEVAVLHDMDGQIVRFLNSNGISAEEHDWSIIDEIGSYQVVYLNGAYTSSGPKPTEEQINGIIVAAKEHDVNLIFADTWGPSYGSLRYLAEFTGDPAQYGSDTMTSADIYVRADVDHPIFDGMEKGVTYTALTNGYAAWFNQYSGRHLGTVGTSRDGMKGSGIAYKAVSEDSAHLLLSTHAASPWVSPYDGWTTEQQRILLNSIEFLKDEANFGAVSGTVTDAEGNVVEGVQVQVVDTGVTVQTSAEGKYELFHDEGTYEVSISKPGFSTQTIEVEFAKGTPVTEDIVLGTSESGTISGTVQNIVTTQQVGNVVITLLDEEGNVVGETRSSRSGDYEITGLVEGKYTLHVEFAGYVTYEESVTVAGASLQHDILLYPVPGVATIGDYGFGGLSDLLDEMGIKSEDYSVSQIIENLPELDVVFFNEAASYNATKAVLDEFFRVADENEVSIIFGDTYYSGGAINHLVNHYGDPASRTQHRNTSNPAGYVIQEENPIFGNKQPGDFVEILIPSGSSVVSFEGYSGYSLADITHHGNNEAHGTGVAYKPRTKGSMELLMSGHGTSFNKKTTEHYTEAGRDMFIDAILWAAYIEYNAVSGYVTDQEGNPLDAQVTMTDGNAVFEVDTDPETGFFEVGSIDGDYTLTVNSFGYQAHEQAVTLNADLAELSIEMVPEESNGSISGAIVDENTLDGIQDAQVNIFGVPRETNTSVSGEFTIERLEPGTYTIEVVKEGYVMLEFDVEVTTGQVTEIEKTMKPSPTVGVIVDTDPGRYLSATDYLTSRGYIVEELFFDDLDQVEGLDVIFVNSDYDNALVPKEDVFRDFLKEVDRTETPIIWTGSSGPRGGIRFLVDYIGDPVSHIAGSNSSSNITMTATKVADHPILEGVHFDENNQFTFDNYYYYGFDGYTGTTLATLENAKPGDLGSFIAVGGRTLNSVEVLLSTMTFGYGYSDKYFDKDRERILNNAIIFALDNEEALVGEIHGTVVNNFEREVFATVTVEETGYTLQTEQDGTFFMGLEDGDYTLSVEAFGHSTKSFDVTVENGEVLEQTFELISDDSGLVSGQIKAQDTNAGIEGATVQLVGTPLQATTDANGNYEIQAPVGTFQVRVTAPGYTPEVVQTTVKNGETATVNFTLKVSQKIAFVATSTNANRALPFLEDRGYEVEFWNNNDIDGLMEVLDEFALVIYNDRHSSSTPEEKFKAFVELADELQISMIFPSQWGSGTIDELHDFYNDPQQEFSDFEDERIHYTVTQNHPIFAGYEVGEEILILQRERYSQQYHAFEDYSGTTIADVTHETVGRLGSGIAFDFRTANSVHVLLGSLQVGGYGHPNDRWTEDAKRIYTNAIDWALQASLGEISGTVTDVDGNPVAGANVSIPDQNIATQTNDEGKYRLGVGIGTYEVQVQAKGFSKVTATVEVGELGDVVVQDFELSATERASLSGTVTDTESKGLKDVSLKLVEKADGVEHEAVTNADGYYQFDELLAGEYDLAVSANGYQSITDTIVLEEGEALEASYTLSEFNIAVLGDMKENLASFLNDKGLPAQKRDWNIVDDVYNYEVIIVNTSKGTEEQLNTLIEKADEYGTSLIFVGTWGVDGSIQLLEEYFGSPNRLAQGYDEGEVFVEAVADHPLFANFDGEEIRVHSEKSPYSTFENYDGITLANLVVDGEDKGTSIAYDFRGENHMHLLLSSFAVTNMIGPKQGWTAEGGELFVEAVKWARDGIQELPSVPEWTVDSEILSGSTVELTGIADYRSTVQVLHGDEVLAETTPNRDNTFTVELTDLAEGTYDLELQVTNFAGSVVAEDNITVIVDATAPTLEVVEPTDQLVIGKEVVEVVGTVADANLAEVLVNDEAVEVVEGEFRKKVILEEGLNVVTVSATDIVGNETIIERNVTVSLDGPVISDVQPSEDVMVRPGDVIDVRIVSEAEGGSASFAIKLPTGANTASTTGHEMTEVEPGVYEGTWTVPTQVDLNRAVIEISLTDVAGNTSVVEAGGKIFISSEQVDRIAGDTRYNTALEISQEGWAAGETDTVILTRGQDFVDALAGVPLAYQLNAPVLLTRSDKLSAGVLDEISRLGAEKVVILGGESAIEASIVSELEAAGLDVRRIAGKNRYETAALIADEVAEMTGTDQAVVANGLDFPDALSVASYAANAGIPILLTKTSELPEATEQAITDLGVSETIIVGGTSVVSGDITSMLPSPERISGSDRYGTNIALAEHFGLDTNHVYVATGRQYADALTGAVLAAKSDSAILLVRHNVPEIVAEFLTESDIVRLTVLGGEAAVSQDVVKELAKLIQ